MLTTENHLTLQAADAHRVATRRDDWQRALANAAWSAICADYRDALRDILPLAFTDREAYCHRYIAATYTAEVRLLEAGAR